MYFTGVEPGRHAFGIRYGRAPAARSAAPAAAWYPAKLAKEDSTTGANWQGAYGSEGSVRFSIGEGEGDETRLPEYVAELTHQSTRQGEWTRLPVRTGYLMTGNPHATRQTMAVELFDLEMRKLIAPVALVEGFGGGKYLVYEYNRSCRIRLDHVSGGDAVISGVFFDPRPAFPETPRSGSRGTRAEHARALK